MSEILVTLPKPELLSVYSRINPSSVNQYTGKRLKDTEIETLYKEIEIFAKDQALSKGILSSARESATKAIESLYAPLLMSDNDYKITVVFENISKDQVRVYLKG